MKKRQIFIVVLLTAEFASVALAQLGLCPAPNGDFPNPSSELCTTFFRCIQGNPSFLRCPANQRFDFLFKMCRPQGGVDCNSQLELFAAPAITSGIGGLGGALTPLVGNAVVGGLGPLGGFGAVRPEAGLIDLLSQLDGNNDGQNENNGLAALLVMSALMNKRNSAGQPEANTGSLQLAPSYPGYNQMSLNTFSDNQDHVTNQNYQQLPDTYGTEDVGVFPGTGAADGRTFIFVPQYIPGQGQISQTQGQDNIMTSWMVPDATDQRQPVDVLQATQQVQNTVHDQIGQPQGQGQVVLPRIGNEAIDQGKNQNRLSVEGQIGQPQVQERALSPWSGYDASVQSVNQGQNVVQGQIVPSLGQGNPLSTWNIQDANNYRHTVGVANGIDQNQHAIQGQIGQPQSHGHVVPPLSVLEAPYMGQTVGLAHGGNQDQNGSQGQKVIPDLDVRQSQSAIQGQIRPRGRLSLRRQGQHRGRGQGYRQKIQPQFQNPLLQPLDQSFSNAGNSSTVV